MDFQLISVGNIDLQVNWVMSLVTKQMQLIIQGTTLNSNKVLPWKVFPVTSPLCNNVKVNASEKAHAQKQMSWSDCFCVWRIETDDSPHLTWHYEWLWITRQVNVNQSQTNLMPRKMLIEPYQPQRCSRRSNPSKMTPCSSTANISYSRQDSKNHVIYWSHLLGGQKWSLQGHHVIVVVGFLYSSL